MDYITELFGCMVFNDKVMRQRLPDETYHTLKETIEQGKELDFAVADVVAAAMKDWALEKGATHFTHWFQPMTGITAEKHDSFISPSEGGGVLLEFSGKELIKGEPDASSFPSGGLRATFEARGYTAWDPTSYAFIKDGTLCIPTAFCAYGGQALDKKTPLLRSMEAINDASLRILRLFGDQQTSRVLVTVGAEQEYFLIDKKMFDARKDLIYTGRTLFGAKPAKGQELDDHYFGAIKPRVMAFMKDLNEELWKLGIYAKTEHNEAAPGQHELAPVFESANVATDHNQLTMELMKKTALKHGMVCLLHEKPFAGITGSGKHNNWSLSTNRGVNLLKPGKSPTANRQFLLFLCAVIKAVDDYQELLRISIASAGNDHRLGASEAPPAIVSIFLGDDLLSLLESIEQGEEYSFAGKQMMTAGAHVLPCLRRDTTDRNRTSPFAFTGNKFEFRMLGSSASVAGPNIVLNTIVADTLRIFAEELEAAPDFNAALDLLLQKTVIEHKRILFNGNNYSEEWVQEAARRGLKNLVSSADALPYFISDKVVSLYVRQGVFTEEEIRARHEIHIEGYCNLIRIEALTMLSMVRKDIIPAVCAYTGTLASGIVSKTDAGIGCRLEFSLCARLSALCERLDADADALEASLSSSPLDHDALLRYTRDVIFEKMREMRSVIDELETRTSSDYWPYPTYGEIITSV